MSKQKYCEIIDQLCEKLDIEDPESMYEACNLEVDGIAFTLTYGDYADEECLLIYTDFGEPPMDAESRAKAFQRLMEINLQVFARNKPNFGFNSETGRVLMMTYFGLTRADLDLVMFELVNVASMVKLWRENFFVTPLDKALDAIESMQEPNWPAELYLSSNPPTLH
jgi:hypothetical protein